MLRATNRPVLAFFEAIKNLRLRHLALILKSGYDPNLMVNARGQNGLQYMVNYFGSTDAHFRLQVPVNKAAYLAIAKLLLDSGLDPNSVDLLSGETVVYDAIRFNDKEMISLLLPYVDFSLRNKNGETPLMCSARFGSKQVMRMILEHLRHLEMDGYFLRQRNRFGLTPLELARVENLECAKVLTKHLVAFGHHTNAVLARSTSHHQLLPSRALPYHVRPAAAAAVAASAFLDDSASDNDSEAALATSIYQPALRAAASGRPVGGYKSSATFYDSRAAEFNQYLLEQQELANEAGADQQYQGGLNSAGVGAISDDDECFFGSAGPSSSGASGLTRSRSCILGPSASGSKQPKYPASGQTSKKGVGDEMCKAGSSWQAGNSSARGNAGKMG